jgi:glycolate oxidase subunit GlcD
MTSAHGALSGQGLIADLRALLGDDAVLAPAAPYLADTTEEQGLSGDAGAVALPRSTEEVSRLLAWSDQHDVAIVPRGGGTGVAGGAIPFDGAVVLSLERMRAIRSFDPQLWRIHVEAGLRTAELHRLARDNGLLFAPDPGAAEQSQIGGNIATNAGGPHAFKYGVTGSWVSGLEAVLASGEVITVGGPIRKDVAGYDLRSLLVGSEGTLAVITAAWLKLIPAPELALPIVALYPDTAAGCAAIERIVGSGLAVAALDYLDNRSIELAGRTFPVALPVAGGFMVLAEADGSEAEARRLQVEVIEALSDAAIWLHTPQARGDVEALWRWRDGASMGIAAHLGGKLSEDIVVPLDRLAEAIDETVAIGARHELEACSWGHAGDGNLHSTVLLARGDAAQRERASDVAEDLFALAIRLGGSVSGEHGLGWVKRGQLARQWSPAALELHEAVKRAFDPKNLLNPGKKLALIRH